MPKPEKKNPPKPKRQRGKCDCGAPLARVCEIGPGLSVREVFVRCPACGELERVECMGRQSFEKRKKNEV